MNPMDCPIEKMGHNRINMVFLIIADFLGMSQTYPSFVCEQIPNSRYFECLEGLEILNPDKKSI